jgi:hypothetical protein
VNGAPDSIFVRLTERLRALVARPPVPSRRHQRALVAASLALFVVAAAIAASRLPPAEGAVRWWLLVPVALLGVPASVVVNAAEFRVSARMAGTRATLGRAVTVMLLARAASLLPLPGGTLVRVGALKQLGASYPRALLATGAVGLTWIAASFAVAGTLLVTAAGDARGGFALLAALAAIGVGVLLVVPDHGPRRAVGLVGAGFAAGLGMVGFAVLRLSVVLLALGYPVSFAQAAVLTVAEVLAMALAIVPGGVGVREVVAGVLATTVGLPASLGVIATVTDRLLEYVVLAPACLAVWLRLLPATEPVATFEVAPEPGVTR